MLFVVLFCSPFSHFLLLIIAMRAFLLAQVKFVGDGGSKEGSKVGFQGGSRRVPISKRIYVASSEIITCLDFFSLLLSKLCIRIRKLTEDASAIF